MSESKAQSGFLKAVEDGKNNYLLDSLSIITLDPGNSADRVTMTAKIEDMRKYVTTSTDGGLQARFGVYADKIKSYGLQMQPNRSANPGPTTGGA
jgi:hypothetical protein